MQGNPKHNMIFNKSFINKAWEQMRVELDRDMPVQEQDVDRSWILAIAFLIIGLVVGSLIGVGLNVSDKNNQEMSLAPLALSSSVDRSEANVIGTDLNEIKKQDKNVSSSDLTVSNIANSEKMPVEIYASGLPVDRDYTIYTPGDLELLGDLAYIPMASGKVEAPESDFSHLAINVKEENSVEELENSKSKKFISDPSVGLTAGVNIFKKNLWGGYYGGIVADYQFAKNFMVRTGFNYSKLNENNVVRYANSPVSRDGTSKNSTSYVQLNHIHYLNVPLAISYKPIKLISFNSGVNVAYMLTSDETYGFIGNLNNLGLNIPSTSTPLDDEAFSNWDISLTYGLSLFPHPNWGFDFSYNFGLSDIGIDRVLNIEEHTTHRQYQISLLYYFYKKRNN